ncbi:MAG: MOSC N-terminal beta barrel domain-containing protein [Actinomycetota bacterium]
MQITAIWRYPVKSLQGEALTEAAVGRFGITGDRAWSLVDLESGTNLTARKRPELLYAAAKVVDGEVVVTLPDGTETNDNAQLSSWIGADIELRKAEEGSAGTFETQADETETGKWYQWNGAVGAFHDSTVSLISLVCGETYRDWDPRRFRINVTLDGTGEDKLVDTAVTLGGTKLHVMKQIDRCVMTTRPQPALGDLPPIERDLSVLKTINAENATFLGVGAIITEPGTIAIGDTLTTDG